jgi:hypothetical protein
MLGQLPDDCTAPSGLGSGLSVHSGKLPDGGVPVVVRGGSGVESGVEVEGALLFGSGRTQ